MNVQFEYEKIYSVNNFERIDLFKCLSKIGTINNVLYLGSSIHITPSFIFQNVTYIDKSDIANEFFKCKESILDYINSRKMYSQTPYINYININYNIDMESIGQKYDLVISINSYGSFESSIKFVRKDGIMLFLPLPQESEVLRNREQVKYMGKIIFTGNKYKYIKDEEIVNRKNVKNKRVIFKENNEYEIYKKEI